MISEPITFVMETDTCRLVVDQTGQLKPEIQLKLEHGWQTAAYLPLPVIERPAGPVEAEQLSARPAEGRLLATARLEDSNGRWEIVDQIQPAPYGFEVRRTWRYSGGIDPQFALLFEVAYPGLQADFWMIPGLMVQGNPISVYGYHQMDNGIGPQPGLAYPSDWDLGGLPWVFSEETPTPSATWLRRGECALGVFSSPQKDLHDLLSAVSLARLEERDEIHTRIYLPSRDLPLLYRDKNGFMPGRQTWLAVSGEWQYTRTFYVLAYLEMPPFSLAGFNRAVWTALAPYRRLVPFSFDEVQDLRSEFLLTYHLRRTPQAIGLIQGLYNDGTVRENWMGDGFLCLNAEFASFLYAYSQRLRHTKHQQIAREIASFFTSQQFPNGLFFSNYYLDSEEWGYQFARQLCFTRPMGERLWNLTELAGMLAEDDPLYSRILDFCRRSAGFFISHQLPNGSFGKVWSPDGSLVEDSGANFSFIIWFLCKLYQLEPDPAYLEAAERSFHHLQALVDSENIAEWVDCLDSAAIDREGTVSLLQACDSLYETSGNTFYLEYARKAAEMALTWQYAYDICFEVDTPLGGPMFPTRPQNPTEALPKDGVSVKPTPKTVFHSAGMTLVSVEHPCMDAWGTRMGYELLRLAEFSGDQHYWERGCAAIMAAQQVIVRQPGDFGLFLVGAQPEQMNSRDWAYGYVALGKGAARVLIAWNQVLNLATLERVRREFPQAATWMQSGDSIEI